MQDTAATPAWLSRILKDKAEAPRLYRWSAATGSASPAGSPDDARNRIYIVGMGNLGRLFAAALARLPNPPPITLVVHRPGLLDAWNASPGLLLHPQGYLKEPATQRATPIVDVDVEMWTESPAGAGDSGGREMGEISEIGPIANLIVATKAQDALPTADRLRRYLGRHSTVAFTQNGMSKLWPPHGAVYSAARYADAAAGPNWVACVVTHGVFSLGPFASVHASPADVVLGSVGGGGVPLITDDEQPPYLVQKLLEAPVLNARKAAQPQLWIMQVEKLVVNSVINPLTAILRCKNGVLFGYGDDGGDDGVAERQGTVLRQVIDQLLQEASTVLTALAAQETKEGGILGPGRPGEEALAERLSFARLRAIVYRVGGVVRDNTSSMLQDVNAGKGTEVGEFNGWVVDMARYVESIGGATGRIDVTAHQTMVDLVTSGRRLSKEQLGSYFAA